MVISFKIIVQQHNQDIDIDTVKVQKIYITTGFVILLFYSYTHFFCIPPPPYLLSATNRKISF